MCISPVCTVCYCIDVLLAVFVILLSVFSCLCCYVSYFFGMTGKELHSLSVFFFFQAEDGIRDLVRSRGLGDVYKRQFDHHILPFWELFVVLFPLCLHLQPKVRLQCTRNCSCLLYTSDAADERSSVDLGGRRIIKKKKPSRLGYRRTICIEA